MVWWSWIQRFDMCWCCINMEAVKVYPGQSLIGQLHLDLECTQDIANTVLIVTLFWYINSFLVATKLATACTCNNLHDCMQNLLPATGVKTNFNFIKWSFNHLIYWFYFYFIPIFKFAKLFEVLHLSCKISYNGISGACFFHFFRA